MKAGDVRKVMIGDNFKSGQLMIKDHFVQFGEKRMILIDETNVNCYSELPFACDWLLIRGNPYIKLDKVISSYKAKELILDQSLSFGKRTYITKEMEKQNLNFADIRAEGALMSESGVRFQTCFHSKNR
ncbi:hypothetical protein ACFLRI_02330 [Bacteroidota bacterium]